MKLRKTFVSLLLLSCSYASCQISPHHESAPTYGDFYAGAAFTSNNPANGTAGLGAGADFRVFRMVAVAGEFDSYIGNTGGANATALFDFLVGPRLAFRRSSRLAPFVDFLGGGQYLKNGSTQHSYYYATGGGAAFAADGGADIRLARHLAIRGELGYSHSTYKTPPTTASNDRMRAGAFVVFRF